MTELDFDELDKAVNSLMANANTTKRNTALDDPEETVVELDNVLHKDDDASADVSLGDATESPVIVNEPAAPVVIAPATTVLTESSTPSLAVKRRGQFMDMVHPSSDMKTAPRPVSRQGTTLSPASSEAIEPDIEQEVPVAESATDAQPTPEALPSENVQETAFELPVENVTEEETAPLTSPFLPGAKPEKRPLGSPASPETLPIPEEKSDVTDETQAPITMPANLPEELSSDVLAVEANDLTSTQQVEEVETRAIVEAPVDDVAPVASTSGGSILQQYTESPSTGDQTSGSIYDTANYHQPIESASPSKKSSPIKWILLVVGLLVAGGGAGVGYFFLTH